MSFETDGPGIPMNANGPAYTTSEVRHGVPLSYVADKLRAAIEDLHRGAQQNAAMRDSLMEAMYHLLVSFLGLHNMLGATADHGLTRRLLGGTRNELDAWRQLVQREGDVLGISVADVGLSAPL